MSSLAAGMQWTAAELLQQQQQQDTAWLTYMRGIGLSILTPWICCNSVLHMLQQFLSGTQLMAKFAATALPVAELASALLVTLVPTTTAGSSSSGRSNTGASRNTRPDLPRGVIAAGAQPVVRSLEKIIYFATHFGQFAIRGLAQPAVAGSVASAEAARSDAVLQILLMYLACTAASIQQQQAGAGTAAMGTRSSSSSSSSNSSNRRKSDVPAPHMSLLCALAPALQQLPASLAELNVMRNIDDDELATLAAASLKCICAVLIKRKQLLQTTTASPYGPVAASSSVGSSTATATGSSSSSSAQQGSVLPRDELLLPLLLTLAELAVMQPSTTDTWLLPAAVSASVMVLHVQCQQLVPTCAAMGEPKATAAGTAVADALAAPVFLQLGPAVMQHLKETAAAPAGGCSHTAAPLAEHDHDVAVAYMTLVVVVLRNSEWPVAQQHRQCTSFLAASSTAHRVGARGAHWILQLTIIERLSSAVLGYMAMG
jgi:hypothetical protein